VIRRSVALLSEVWDGELRGCRVATERIVIARLGDDVYAYEDRCPHLGVPLSEGELRDGVITCRAHRFCYDARTGTGVNPRGTQLRSFPTWTAAGQIVVEVGKP